MATQERKEVTPSSKAGAYLWDKRLLLGFVGVIAIAFIVLNREANSFMSDARLYPYVVTILGFALCALSLVRIATGKEPNHDAQNGKEQEGSEQQIRKDYKNIVGYLLVFSVFYGSIWLIGFLVSACIFMFGFMRYFNQPYLKAVAYTICGFIMVMALSRILHLELPIGVVVQWLIK